MKAKVKAKKVAPKRPTRRAASPVKQTRRGRSSTSRISSKHQVTIPVEVLRLTNFEIGDEVEFEITDDGGVAIKKAAPINPFEALAGIAGDIYKGFDLAKEREESWPD
jgi:bifunctional DNA-binding transcriptional regulator/antitoxin component of YhaV-PrlF toxin-antitoxin module